MYITKAQLDSRLAGEARLKVETKTRKPNAERTETPRELRVLAGALSEIDTQTNISRELGITQTAISNANKGLVGRKFDPSLKEEIQNAAAPLKADISNKALDTLMEALDVVTLKVKETKAVDASMIAKNMAIVHEKMSPKDTTANGPRVLIQINAPRQKSESDYDFIEVATA